MDSQTFSSPPKWISLCVGDLKFAWLGKEDGVEVRSISTGNLILRCPEGGLLHPWLNGRPVERKFLSLTALGDQRVLATYQAADLERMEVEFSCTQDGLDVSCRFQPHEDAELNRIDLFPEGTELNLFDAFNFRNRHHHSATSPELPLGGKGCETDTSSRDWQFAPHPTAFLLRANEYGLFCGELDLGTGFGFSFAAADYRLRHWYQSFGDEPHGQKLQAGELFQSSRFRFFYDEAIDPLDFYASFGRMLIKEGLIPDPSRKQRAPWWNEPLYCTWVDQYLGADAKIAEALQDQSVEAGACSAIAFLNEDLVRKAVAVIERENLPFRTILLDDGWQMARGQWEPDPQRFPDFRGLVDDLHARGFKVLVWWNWAEIQKHAEVDPAHLMGQGWINRHGNRVRDFSHPLTQSGYLRPFFQRLFSSEEGCFDLDGVKTDFLADKIHPECPLYDPAWRGEENYFARVTHLFVTEMRRHKPDALHIGCAGNYRLADDIDINRTYDVHNSNWEEHRQRALMLEATTPGCPAAFDFHLYLENYDRWFAVARSMGAPVEVGNILWMKRDRFSPTEPATETLWEMLRNELPTSPSLSTHSEYADTH